MKLWEGICIYISTFRNIYIKRIPELSLHHQTATYNLAAGWAKNIRQNASRPILGPGGTGVVAEIGKGEPIVALRADIDALPIVEENNLAGWQLKYFFFTKFTPNLGEDESSVGFYFAMGLKPPSRQDLCVAIFVASCLRKFVGSLILSRASLSCFTYFETFYRDDYIHP